MDIKKIIEIEFQLKNGEKVKTTNQQIIKSVIDAGTEYKVLNTEMQKVDNTSEALAGANEALNKSYSSVKQELRATKEAMVALVAEGKEVSTEYQQLAARAAQLGDAQDTVNERINAQKSLFDGAINTTRSLVGSYGAVQGALNLMGVESEESMKALVKLQSLMAISTGLDEVTKLGEAFNGLKANILESTVVTKLNGTANKATAATMKLLGISANTTSVAFKTLKTALISTGILAFVVLIGVLIANFDKLTAALGLGKSANERYIDSQKLQIEESRRAVDSFIAEEITLRKLGATEDEIARKRRAIQGEYEKDVADTANAIADQVAAYDRDIKRSEDLIDVVQSKAAKKRTARKLKELKEDRDNFIKENEEVLSEYEKIEDSKDKIINDAAKLRAETTGNERQQQLALLKINLENSLKLYEGNLEMQTLLTKQYNQDLTEIIKKWREDDKKTAQQYADDRFERQQRDNTRLINITKTGFDKELALYDLQYKEILRQAKKNKEDLNLVQLEYEQGRSEIILRRDLAVIEQVKNEYKEIYTAATLVADARQRALNINQKEYDEAKGLLDLEIEAQNKVIANAEEIEQIASRTNSANFKAVKELEAYIKESQNQLKIYKEAEGDAGILDITESELRAQIKKINNDIAKAKAKVKELNVDVTNSLIEASKKATDELAKLNKKAADLEIKKRLDILQITKQYNEEEFNILVDFSQRKNGLLNDELSDYELFLEEFVNYDKKANQKEFNERLKAGENELSLIAEFNQRRIDVEKDVEKTILQEKIDTLEKLNKLYDKNANSFYDQIKKTSISVIKDFKNELNISESFDSNIDLFSGIFDSIDELSDADLLSQLNAIFDLSATNLVEFEQLAIDAIEPFGLPATQAFNNLFTLIKQQRDVQKDLKTSTEINNKDILALEVKLGEAKVKTIREYETRIIKERLAALKLIKDKTIENYDEIDALESELLERRGLRISQHTQDQIDMYANMVGEINNSLAAIYDLYDGQMTKIEQLADRDIAASERKRDAELENAEYSAAQREQIERDYAKAVEKIEADKADKIKKIQKKQATVKLAMDLSSIISSTAVAVMRTLAELGYLAGAIPAALVGATGGLQAAVAVQQYNLVKQMKRGGLLVGASHANGGIMVGNTGVEVEGGEAVINKNSTKQFAPLLSAINQAGGGVPIPTPKFEMGGSMPNLNNMNQNISNGKPIRAYIVQKDVANNDIMDKRIKRQAKLN